MTWTSELYPNEPVIGETDPTPVHPNGEHYGKGYEMRDYSRHPVGYSSRGKPFGSTFAYIPRDEWDDRIAEKEKQKSRISDLMLANNVPSLDQDGTSYCWFFGVVGACEARRVVAGLPFIRLSPASGAAKIKNFRNQGGWGADAMDWMVEHGVCTDATWPQDAISRSYDTGKADAERENFRLIEWTDIESEDFDALATMLLQPDPVPCPLGLDWWGHLIYACDLVRLGTRQYGARIRNSWSDDYGDQGFAVLTERKCLGDAYGPRVMRAFDGT